MRTVFKACLTGAGAFGAVWCATGWAPAAAAETEVIGKVSQPIVVGDPVSVNRQRRMGLVTVGGGCSGTLINRYWVLTADHCVASNPQVFGSADAPFANKQITATWTARTATPTRYVRYWNSTGLDVALIFLGAGDLGHVDRKLIFHGEPDDSLILTKFGQGICSYATAGPPAQAAQTNCGYRTAVFTPSSANTTSIVLPVNDAGQVGNGGDSGGPDYVTDGEGNLLSIASVQSTCNWTGMAPGRTFATDGWNWVTGISSCQSASLFTIRDDIHRVMSEVPPPYVATAKDKFGDRIVARPEGVVSKKSPGAYKDVMIGGASGGSGMMVAEAGAVAPVATCKPGYVWRVARPEDLVCVTPEARDRTAQENATAASRVDPAGAWGPNTCISGFVWREAFDGDVVCVEPAVRDLVRAENAAGPSLRQ